VSFSSLLFLFLVASLSLSVWERAPFTHTNTHKCNVFAFLVRDVQLRVERKHPTDLDLVVLPDL
jgi:hypothetical protein